MEGKACFYSNLWRKPVALASQKIKFRNRVVVICLLVDRSVGPCMMELTTSSVHHYL